MDRARRSSQPLTVLAVDVDFFKRLNDTHGNAAGDAALSSLAALISAHSRSHDLAGRLGGEEFALLLPDTDLSAAMKVAERLREAVHGMPAAQPVTISIGVSTCSGSGATTPNLDDLLTEADAALYAAKDAGCDRVEVYQAPAETSVLA